MLERQPDLEVVGQAADGQTAVEIARNLAPDVILMDVSLPGINGLPHQGRPLVGVVGCHPVGRQYLTRADPAFRSCNQDFSDTGIRLQQWCAFWTSV